MIIKYNNSKYERDEKIYGGLVVQVWHYGSRAEDVGSNLGSHLKKIRAAKKFNGSCVVHNPKWARVGTLTLCPAVVRT